MECLWPRARAGDGDDDDEDDDGDTVTSVTLWSVLLLLGV